MFNSQKAYIALQQKRSLFEEYARNNKRLRQVSDQQLRFFESLTQIDLTDLIERSGSIWPGALATEELDLCERLCMPFDQQWTNHQEAREWARDTLKDHPILAVDGSQITPSTDLATPVGAVQIGWFINSHNAQGDYVKDLDFEVFLPQDLIEEEGSNQELDFASRRVNQERFVRECEKLCELMAQFGDKPDAEKPLCLYDGSFIISFAGQLQPALAAPYLGAIQKLLHCSKRYRVPVIGFVDGPHSRDIARLIELALTTDGHRYDGHRYHVQQESDLQTSNENGNENSEEQSHELYAKVGSHDAELLSSKLAFNRWGVRSPLFICAREDALTTTDLKKGEDRAAFYKTVAFTYLRLNQNRAPARIEIPTWIVEEGRAEEIINLVRAECIVGVGYPYAIETADALAVISQRDRQRFYGLVRQAYPDFDLTPARKAASKMVRR